MTKNLRLVAPALALLVFGATARGAYFGGTHADITDFANGSEVSTRGTLIDAVNLANDGSNPSEDVTINGVYFKGMYPGFFHEWGEDFADASFVYHGGWGYVHPSLWEEGGAYDLLADSQIYAMDSWEIDYGDGFGVVNLVPGEMYELQIFMLDSRDSQDKTFPIQVNQATWTGNYDEYVQYDPAPPTLGWMSGITIGGAGTTQANGEIATMVFSIDEGFNGLFVNTWDNGAFNGMQLRLLGVAGDYDGSGTVDEDDYAMWKSEYGTVGESAADGNFDGVVDAADYTMWRNNYVPAAAGVTAIVPEPASLVVGLIAVATVSRLRRRRGDR